MGHSRGRSRSSKPAPIAGRASLFLAAALAFGCSDTTAPDPIPTIFDRILFNTDRDGDFEIYVINADGTGAANLTTAAGADQFANWTPAR